MNRYGIYGIIGLFICPITTGCSKETDDTSSEVPSDSGNEIEDASGEAPSDSGIDSSNIATKDGSTKYPLGDACAAYPGINDYETYGVNRFIYNLTNRSTDKGSPISQLEIYCFTKGIDCDKYSADIRLFVDSENISYDPIISGDNIYLLACNKMRNGCDLSLMFLIDGGGVRVGKGYISIGTKIETKDALIKTNKPPFNCESPPHVYLSGPLESAQFYNPPYPVVKEEDDAGNITTDAGSFENYITLKDSERNIVADFR